MKKEQFEIPELTRASSKGQIVIPTNVRKKLNIKEGSTFAVTSKKNIIVLKKLDTKIKPEDLRTLKLLEEAWKDIENGRYKSATPDDFFKEMAKWKK
ncbi:MAG: AbrB/MazE/SpoVT family DNA-binding domain-containing protein [Candidatus Aenigmarchaeota archaeon]|nr:AbrB/MazE/SpoVT family DNA-binding domain-containing protein [Candidatus Aenigmarchaeota archaeon]